MNYIKLFGTRYNTDHFKMICPSSRMMSPDYDWSPCVYFYQLDGASICATDFVNKFTDERAAKQSAESSLEQAFKDLTK